MRHSTLPVEAVAPDWAADRISICRHFVRDMESLWEGILKLAAVVETALTTSVQAVIDRRPDLALEVKGGESAINTWEVRIEQECLKILALHQPVASDLRRVAGVMKVNGDLERMADLADHIANRARKLSAQAVPLPIPRQMEALAQAALSEVRDSFDALALCDAALARRVISADRGVDRLRGAVVKELKASILREPERLNSWLRLINTARNLERIADHATNVAEAVVYIKEGEIIRHVGERQGKSA